MLTIPLGYSGDCVRYRRPAVSLGSPPALAVTAPRRRCGVGEWASHLRNSRAGTGSRQLGSIALVPASGTAGVGVSLTWQGTSNLDADYEVWRRTPPDRSFQEVQKYATVLAGERQSDGMFTFTDPAPFSLPDRPCYMVGATVGGVPPSSFAPDVCIPTLPSAMATLTLVARPGPDAGEWYVDGGGFAPGAEVLLQELTCPSVPCADAGLAVSSRAASDGRVSERPTLSAAAGPRTIVAWERGWLPSQLTAAPTVAVPSPRGSAGLGYPLSVRTGLAEADAVIEAIASRDPLAVAALIQPYNITRGDGSHGTGIWAWQCGEVVRSANFEALTGELVGDAQALYAVYRVTPTREMPRIFEAAEYVAVFAGKAVVGSSSSGSMVGIKDGHIVSIAIHCGGTTPTWFIRDTPEFLLVPWEGGPPGPPTTGTGTAERDDDHLVPLALSAVGLILVLAALAWVKGVSPRRR